MGHLLFLILHFIAAMFGAVLLFVTIPLHLIYCAVGGKTERNQPNYRTHVICPSCRELVRKEASICPHCRQGLVPQEITPWWVLDSGGRRGR